MFSLYNSMSLLISHVLRMKMKNNRRRDFYSANCNFSGFLEKPLTKKTQNCRLLSIKFYCVFFVPLGANYHANFMVTGANATTLQNILLIISPVDSDALCKS